MIDLFDINILSKSGSFFSLSFIYEPTKWNMAAYRYIVSERSDLKFAMVTLNSASFKVN